MIAQFKVIFYNLLFIIPSILTKMKSKYHPFLFIGSHIQEHLGSSTVYGHTFISSTTHFWEIFSTRNLLHRQSI